MNNQVLELLYVDDQHEVFVLINHLYLSKKKQIFFNKNYLLNEYKPITAPASREVINKRISIPDADE